jgi:hypothetical protein
MKKFKITLIKDTFSLMTKNRNFHNYISSNFSSKHEDRTHHYNHSHKNIKHENHHHHIHQDHDSNYLDWKIEDLPNINTTKSLNGKETSTEFGNHNHGLSSTRKIYGNMSGMDKVDEYITTEGLDKEFLKDGAKSTRRPEKGEYVFRGNLNIDPDSPPEKDVTDDNKTIN